MRFWMCLACCLVACGGGSSTDTCATTADCPSGQRCVDEACVPITERDAGGCTDCECTADDDCPAVAPCAESRCSAGVCEVVVFDERCAPLGVCDVVRGCVERPDAGIAVDAGTDAGEPDAGTDAGIDAGPPPPGPVGAACEAVADCQAYRGLTTPQCVQRLRDGTTFSGGYCSLRCTAASGCPTGTVCWRNGFLDSYCLDACDVGADCRLGYACRIPPAGTLDPSGMTVCYPGRAVLPASLPGQ